MQNVRESRVPMPVAAATGFRRKGVAQGIAALVTGLSVIASQAAFAGAPQYGSSSAAWNPDTFNSDGSPHLISLRPYISGQASLNVRLRETNVVTCSGSRTCPPAGSVTVSVPRADEVCLSVAYSYPGERGLSTDGTFTLPPIDVVNEEGSIALAGLSLSINDALPRTSAACGYRAPIARNDAITVKSSETEADVTEISATLLGNDSDPDRDRVQFNRIEREPANGTLVSLSGEGSARLNYSPKVGFTGTDQFTYSVIDSGANGSVSNAATVAITVTNEAPRLAIDTGGPYDTLEVNEGATATVDIVASDRENGILTFTYTDLPAFCTISSPANGIDKITCNPGYSDQGTYRAAVRVDDNGVPTQSDKDAFTISVNDRAAPTLSMAAATQAVDETIGDALVRVERGGFSGSTVTVDYSVTAISAEADQDYRPVSGTLSFAEDASTPQSIRVPIINDRLYEPGDEETFVVRLSSPSGGATLGDSSETTVRIKSEDTIPTVSLGVATATAPESDSSVALTVSRSGGLPESGTVSVGFATADGTATAGADYTAVSDTLTWEGADVTARTITIPLLPDEHFEGTTPETFTVTLSGISENAAISPTVSATVSIEESETESTLSFDPTLYTVNENEGTETIWVRRTGAPGGALSVSYDTEDISASSGHDYIRSMGTLDWADGDTAPKSFAVPILDDDAYEGDASGATTEQFRVLLSDLSGSGVIGERVATVTVGDNESPPELQFEVDSVSVAESAGTLAVNVVRLNASRGAVSVNYATRDVTAEAGRDYAEQSGTLRWADGDSAAKQLTLRVTDDEVFELDETFEITLSNPLGESATVGSTGVLQVTITEDAPPPTLAFEQPTREVDESAGTVTLNVTRSSATPGPISVAYATADGTARAGEDYEATSGVLSWDSGVTGPKEIVVPISNDAAFDGSTAEQFSVTLSDPTAPAVLGPQSTIEVAINDDDPVPALTVSSSAIEALESDATVTLTIARSGAAAGAILLDYRTVDGTATAGTDYEGQTDTVEWKEGDLDAKDIVINLLNDEDFEGADGETFSIEFGDPGGEVELDVSTVNITLMEEELAPRIEFDLSEQEVEEDSGALVLTVTRTGRSAIPSSVDYAIVAGTAEPGTDFEAETGTVVWAPDDPDTQEIPLSLINDDVFEDPREESFTVELSNPTGAELAAAKVHTITVVDDDIMTGSAAGIAGPDLLVKVDKETGMGNFDLVGARSARFRSYEWRLESGDVIGSSPSVPQSMPPGEYVYTLKVLDDSGATLTDSTDVSVTRELVQAADKLQDLEGLTENERAVAITLDSICGRLNTRTALTADQDDLRERCSQIILNDDIAEKVAALGAVGGQQITGQMTNALQIGKLQFRNIAQRQRRNRESDERNATAGLNINVKGKQIPAAAMTGLVDLLTGGNAGEDTFGRWAFFVSGDISFGEHDQTDRETGFDFNTAGLTAGFDYRFNDKLFAGFALGYGQGDADFDRRIGSLNTDAWTATAFASYATDRYYLDGQFSYGLSDHDIKRNIRYNDAVGTVERTARGSTDGSQWSVGMESGLNISRGAWLFNPNVSAFYTDVNIDNFSESGSRGLDLRYGDQNSDSLTLSGGLSMSYTYTTEHMVIVPQLRLDYVFELANDGQVINVRFLNDPFANDGSNPSPVIALRTDAADSNYATVGLGVTAQFVNGISGFVDWQTAAAYADMNINSFSYGLRWERLF